MVDAEKSKSVSKKYFFDYAAILNALLILLEKHPGTLETVVKHNEGKTLKFILRNLFFIVSAHIDGRNGSQVILKNLQSYNAQKLPDRLSILVTFLARIATCRTWTPLKVQAMIQDV